MKFRNAMKKQVLAGKMIGGVGWSSLHVQEFFGGQNFYGIPSNGVMKNGDPCGRIVHDYGYHPKDSYSVNSIQLEYEHPLSHDKRGGKYPGFSNVLS